MSTNNAAALFALLVLLQVQQIMADCPLDLSWSNFTLAATMCSNQVDRGKCCRYINAFVSVTIANYANITGGLGVSSNQSKICLDSVSEVLQLYGISHNVIVACGLGTKIPFTYQCMGRKTVREMLESPKFEGVAENCKLPLSSSLNCKRCLNAGISYLHQAIGVEDNLTLSTCRDATFVTLASQMDNLSAVGVASCFFGAQWLSSHPAMSPSPSSSTLPKEARSSPSSLPSLQYPSERLIKKHQNHYNLTIIAGIGVSITGLAVLFLIILVLLIRKKNQELKSPESPDKTSWKVFHSRPLQKFQEGSSTVFKKFSYNETKKATGNFSSIIGRGGYGTVYKAEFGNDFVAAVKRMNKISEQGEDEFCREMEIVARLHHRHLVALKGYCIEKHERFLVYEYMKNGSLKDHLHSPGRTPLSWQRRMHITIDVANALEYLHFYCDPPLCHRDIKSSNILLDENFVAKVADFGLAYAFRNSAFGFEPVNTDIRGTPGYMDPEYMVTQELTEKSDIYSYGVLLLELVTGRRAVQDNRNLVEWAQKFMVIEAWIPEMVDPLISNSFDLEQLHTVVKIIKWCTQREGKDRPSIKHVLRFLHEKLDLTHETLVDDERINGEKFNMGKLQRGEMIYPSGDARCLQSSSSTSRSYCSRSVLLETGSPQSPTANVSI